MKRGTGRTRRQLEAAPQNAVFVWWNEHTGYATALARYIERLDITVVSPDWLLGYYWRGWQRAVILDHATRLTTEQMEAYRDATNSRCSPAY